MINDKLQALDNRETNIETYKDLSWSHAQAHFNGQRQELTYLLKVLDPGESE